MGVERTAVVIIRAWREPNSSAPLRVHLRRSTDVAQGFEQALSLSDIDAVAQAVRTWLQDFEVASPPPPA